MDHWLAEKQGSPVGECTRSPRGVTAQASPASHHVPARPDQGAAPASPALVVDPSILSLAVECGFIYSGGREVEQSGFISARVCFFLVCGAGRASSAQASTRRASCQPQGCTSLGVPQPLPAKGGDPSPAHWPQRAGKGFPPPKASRMLGTFLQLLSTFAEAAAPFSIRNSQLQPC